MTKFNDDLTTGHCAEEYVLSQLKKEFPTLKQVKVKNKDYDLVDDSGYSFEVKYDILSKDTGNVGFELECYGKPSGLKATKANEWIHIFYVHGKWVYTRVAVGSLKSFLKSNKDYLKVVMGGDNNASKMVLVDAYVLTDIFSFWPISSTSST